MPDLHVALVTPRETRGGIATYSEQFSMALRDEGATVTPVAIAAPETANPREFNAVLGAIPPDADVIHVQYEAGVFGSLGVTGVCAPFLFRRLARTGPPVATTIHEVHRRHDHRGALGDRLLRLRDQIIERRILGASDIVFVHTYEAAAVLADRHGESDAVVRLPHPANLDVDPVDTETAKARLDVEGFVVLIFGWVEAKKRYEDVIRVLPELPDATCVIAGEPRRDSDRDVLRSALDLAANLGVEERVEYLGYVNEEEVPVVLSAADVVVLPYRRVGQSGVVNLALSHRRPVVTSSLPAFEELADEFGCIETYEDHGELVDLVRSLKTGTDPERLDRIDRYLEAVSWPSFAERTVQAYRAAREPVNHRSSRDSD